MRQRVAVADSYFWRADSGQGKTAEAFKYGEVAYLLDGGTGVHSNIWTQGADYPILGTGSSTGCPWRSGNTVCTGDGNLYRTSDGRQLLQNIQRGQWLDVHLSPGGESVELKGNGPGEMKIICFFFTPSTAVAQAAGKYTAAVRDSNIDLAYAFALQTPGDTNWYKDGQDSFILSTEAELLAWRSCEREKAGRDSSCSCQFYG